MTLPIALVAGVRAIGWAAAQLKAWTDGETLTAADLNANFAALAAEQTPAKVLENFNAGVTAGGTTTLGAITAAATKFDLRWVMQHAAAGAACAALSTPGDSPAGHVVIPRVAGVTCAASCAANSGGYPMCRAMVAIGSILPTQATAATDIVATNYNYACTDAQNGFDETKGQGLVNTPSFYSGYCCCYR